MKTFFLALGSIILLFFILILLAIFPSMLYFKIVAEGIDNDWLKLPPSNKVAVSPFENYISKQKGSFSEEEGLWEMQHFVHFSLPFPKRHPRINFIPLLGQLDRPDYFSLGAKFENNEGIEFFTFIVGKPIKLDHLVESQKLFMIPYFKNQILKNKLDKVWKDIFSMDLTLPIHQGWNLDNIVKSLQKIITKPIDELVYRLYVTHLRYSLLDNRLGQVTYYSESARGIFEVNDLPSDLFRTEEILLLDKGVVYRIIIKSKKDSFFPETIRKRFIVNTSLKEDREEDAIGIYNRFKNLTYDQKIDQVGLTTLYAAWSHVIENKDFLKEIIRYLERGKGNYRALEPLYFYAYKKYGTNLSSQNEKIEEDAATSLKRKMAEELDVERKKAQKTIEDVHEGEFASPEERVQYYLKRAKEMEEINLDKNSEFLED